MKIIKYFLIAIFLLPCLQSSSQVLDEWAPKSEFHKELWNIYNAHTRISFISYPWMKVNGVSGFPTLFEANISPYFIFYRGNSRSRRQIRSFQLYFNPELTLRMYSQDPVGVATNSLPVRPLNFHPRLSAVKFIHKKNAQDTPLDKIKSYSFIETTAAHFSNGQENPHFWPDSVRANGDSIPNYAGGNFSTNYWNVAYTHGWFDKMRNNYSVSAYIQNDGGIGDLFSFDDAQIKSYGQWRLGATFQFITKKVRLGHRNTKVGFSYDEAGKAEKVIKDLNYNVTFQVRYKPEVIIDDVSLYPGNKNRLSHRATLVLHPLNWRHTGIFMEFYTGRDFYNIRYYDQITQFKIGITASPDFYIPRK